ncbi:hypothetical protein MLD38_024626 [Melastoma candidum]|uniref:Uncharacterized protein n=1 Tax=Melastoma candidum TaxID=119954 RepID=A0ACB9NUK6_9MYRT|nr:hypothetical protein MLD38_024626 [Melastoma candidum]
MNDSSRCYFHPDEVPVGVCPLCLHEKLVVLAAKRNRKGCRRRIPSYGPQGPSFPDDEKRQGQRRQRDAAAAPHKILALRWLFFNRHWKSDSVTSYHDASSSPEDSFISIRFEDNGLSSWEKNAASKASYENCKASWNQGLSKSTKGKDAAEKEHHHQDGGKRSSREANGAVEHARPHTLLRWRRRIGRLFKLIRWKRSSKGNVCHVDGVKVRNGWLRTLTRRKVRVNFLSQLPPIVICVPGFRPGKNLNRAEDKRNKT